MTLIPDGLAARVGETKVYAAPEPLSRASIRYYADAVGDDNPVYRDPDVARARGWDDVIAPPTLLCDTNQYRAGARDEDGFAGHTWNIEIPGTRLVRGGNDYTFHRPARPDDVVTVTWRLADISERTRADGSAMVIVTSEQEVRDEHGDPILTNTETVIYVQRADGAA